MNEPHIIINALMTAEDRQAILQRYINRDTLDSPWNDAARRAMNKGPATLTDQQWIDAHVWERLPDGSIRMAEGPSAVKAQLGGAQ